MASRSRNGATFDHGAQFFTVRDPSFESVLRSFAPQYLVHVWCHGFPTPTTPQVNDGHPRYRIIEGMYQFPGHLAQGHDLLSGVRVTRLRRMADGWEVQLENEEIHRGRALLLTPPVPQSLALLHASDIKLPPDRHDTLAAITYDPCLALLIQLNGESAVPSPGAIRPASEPLHILTDNYQKGVSRRPGALTLHAGPVFSREYYQAPEAEIREILMEAAAPWLGSPRESVELHRWRYSHPVQVHPERFLAVDAMRLCFAGDAFGGPRVEGAVLSGLAAGRWLSDRLEA